MCKFISTCLLTPIFSVLSSAAHAILIPACPVSAGVYEYEPNVVGDEREGCAVPADTYAFTLHRAGLCRSFVSFPADAVAGSRDSGNATLFPPQDPARVLGSDCVTVFESASGASVVINAAGETTISGGTLTPPPLGETYTHVFAVVGKNLTYATTKTFSVPQTSDGKGSGVKCWTEAGSFTVSAIPVSGTSILPRVRCGSADAPLTAYGSITQVTDCFEPGGGITGLHRCFYQLDRGNNVAVWLTDATNLQKVTSTGAVERLVFVQRLASPLSGEISNLNLGFSTTQAVGLLGSDDQDNTVSYATQGNFVFRVTTR